MFTKSCDSQGFDRTDEFFRMAGALQDPNKVIETFNEVPNDEEISEEMLDF